MPSLIDNRDQQTASRVVSRTQSHLYCVQRIVPSHPASKQASKQAPLTDSVPFRPESFYQSASINQSINQIRSNQKPASLTRSIRVFIWWRSATLQPSEPGPPRRPISIAGGQPGHQGFCCACSRVSMANFTQEATLEWEEGGKKKLGRGFGRVWVGSVDGRCWGEFVQRGSDYSTVLCSGLSWMVPSRWCVLFVPPEKPRVAVLGFSTLFFSSCSFSPRPFAFPTSNHPIPILVRLSCRLVPCELCTAAAHGSNSPGHCLHLPESASFAPV